MRKSMKIAVLLLSVVMLAATITGCALTPAAPTSASTTPATSTSAAPAPAEKVPLSFYSTNNDGMNEYLTDFIKRFQTAYPNIELKAQVIQGNTSDFDEQMKTLVLSGSSPDVSYQVLGSFISFGTAGYFKDIGKYIDSWEDKDDIFQGALDMGLIGGKYVGIGAYPAPILFAYRTDLFQGAGLDPNDPPSNWEELVDYAVKLTKKDAKGNIIQTGFEFPYSDNTINISQAFMLMNDCYFVDEAKGIPTFTDPGVIETLEWLQDFAAKGVSVPSSWNNRQSGPFYAGKAAMAYQQVSDVKAIVKAMPELDGKIRFAPPLSHKKKGAFCGYRLVSIWDETKQPDAAFDLMKFFLSPEEMKIRCDMYGFIPVRKSLSDYYTKQEPDVNEVALETVECGKGAAAVSFASQIYSYYNPAYEAIMAGKADVKTVMAEAEKQLKTELGIQ